MALLSVLVFLILIFISTKSGGLKFMWKRFWRAVASMFGFAVDAMENPELILQQSIRDMKDRVPQLTNAVAQVMGTERLLSKQKERVAGEISALDGKIKAAVKQGRDDIATAYIGQLQSKQTELADTDAQLAQATMASKQAVRARDQYILNMKQRTTEAMALISASKQAKIQEQLAQTMESFDVGTVGTDFSEMRDKIDRRLAESEAKLQLGTSSVEHQMAEIDFEADKMAAQEKLLEYKQQAGLLSAAPAEAEIEDDTDAIEAEVVEETIEETASRSMM